MVTVIALVVADACPGRRTEHLNCCPLSALLTDASVSVFVLDTAEPLAASHCIAAVDTPGTLQVTTAVVPIGTFWYVLDITISTKYE